MAHKYETVAADIREIISTSLAPHDALPSERDLMTRYDVSRMTVRAAIAKLVDEGRVYNVHGSGTYVGSIDLFSKTPKLTSFTEDMTSRGYVASSRPLALARIDADEDIARRLGVPVDTECTHLRRLRLADNNPMAIEDVYLPRTVMEIEQLHLDQSLYVQLTEAGHEVHRAEQEIQAIMLSEEDSRLLGVPNGSAALSVERVSTSRRGLVIEFARTIYRSDRYSFHIAVTRDNEK
ncbi:GntR family transcriptional regulator [Leifsonia kafniensis]|uniref:GntR family transcriptional regulator n=1 Tax=Leifsonia kafniensis TaxID=475957 RepID=A0ABP7KE10_9MICO